MKYCPFFLFFIAFKWYGIYVATVVGMATTFLQVILTRIFAKKWDKKQIITLAVFLVFGGMTLYFHNPIFVKWKPTLVFWCFAVAIFFTHFFSEKTLIERLLVNALQGKVVVPISVLRRLNLIWGVSFLLLGLVNLYVAYFYSNDAWVNFKFYGITGIFLILGVFQALYLSRYLSALESKPYDR